MVLIPLNFMEGNSIEGGSSVPSFRTVTRLNLFSSESRIVLAKSVNALTAEVVTMSNFSDFAIIGQ